MKHLITMILLLTGIGFAAEITDTHLTSSVDKIGVHVKAIHEEARMYLEAARTVVKPEDTGDILIRKLALKKSHEKNSPFDVFRDKAATKKDKEEQSVLNQALASNDIKKLRAIVESNLTANRNNLIEKTAALLIKIAEGKQRPIHVTRTRFVNGKKVTEKLERGSYEAKEVEKLSKEYSKIVSYLHITAVKQ